MSQYCPDGCSNLSKKSVWEGGTKVSLYRFPSKKRGQPSATGCLSTLRETDYLSPFQAKYVQNI